MFGCQRKEFETTQYAEDQKRNVIFAALEDVQTRTSLGEDNKAVWSEGDELISFMNNSYGSKYEVSSESVGQSSGAFILQEEASRGFAMDFDILFYPYDSNLTCYEADKDNYRISNVTFPSVQIYKKGSFAEGAMPMVAVAESGAETFSFKNIGGILKLQLTGDSAVRSIVVTGNASELLSGAATIMLPKDGSAPVVQMMEKDVFQTVELDCGDNGVQLNESEPVDFMIALPPVFFEKGFKIKIADVDGGFMEKETEAVNEVSRSGILKMPSLVYSSANPVPSAVIELQDITYDDIRIKVKVKNSVQYCGGYKIKESFSLPEVVRDANWKKVPRMTDQFVYEGSLSGFPTGNYTQLSGGKTYVVWVAPYGEGQVKVTEDDIVYREFSLPKQLPEGTVNDFESDAVIGHHSITVNLKAENATMIYALLLKKSDLDLIAEEDAKIEYLFNYADPVKDDEVTITKDALDVGESVCLIAFAVDSEGRYGKVYEREYVTRSVDYNESLKLNLSVTFEDKSARIHFNPEGGNVKRYYWFCDKTGSTIWKKYFGETLASSEKYITSNFDSYYLKSEEASKLDGGCIELNDLFKEEEYTIVVMAEDVNGHYSHAAMLKFVNPMDLGDFVYRTGENASLWSRSKPGVTFGDCGTDGEFYTIQWSVRPAAGTTAYSACVHPNIMASCSNAEEMAVYIYNNGTEVKPDVKNVMLYGDESYMVYVTWCDSNGNFYEPFGVTVP